MIKVVTIFTQDMNCSPGDPSQYWTWSKGSYAMSTMSTPKVNAEWTVIFRKFTSVGTQ